MYVYILTQHNPGAKTSVLGCNATARVHMIYSNTSRPSQKKASSRDSIFNYYRDDTIATRPDTQKENKHLDLIHGIVVTGEIASVKSSQLEVVSVCFEQESLALKIIHIRKHVSNDERVYPKSAVWHSKTMPIKTKIDKMTQPDRKYSI